MNILILTQRWYPDTFGGSEYVASEQARGLARRGHQVVVITERVRDSLPTFQEEKVTPPKSPPSKGGEGGAVRIFRYGNEKMFARFGGRSRADIKEVPRMIRELTPPSPPLNKGGKDWGWDVAVLHHPFSAYGFFKARLNIPSLYIFHASTAKEIKYERPSWLGSVFAWWAGRVERGVLKRADRVAVLSKFSKQALLYAYPFTKGKVFKLAVGIDAERFSPVKNREKAKSQLGLFPNNKIILTVRRLVSRMGISDLIESMEQVVKSVPGARLVIVGKGPLGKTLKDQVKQSGLANYVTFAGAVPADNLPLYYQAADVFVLPTRAYEGLGIATLEALASGLPVLGTPVGETPAIIGRLGTEAILKGTGADIISQGIIGFFALPLDKHREMEKKARQIAQQFFNMEYAIDDLEKTLKSLRKL